MLVSEISTTTILLVITSNELKQVNMMLWYCNSHLCTTIDNIYHTGIGNHSNQHQSTDSLSIVNIMGMVYKIPFCYKQQPVS